MMATLSYNRAVRRYFADPQHAGKLQEDIELTLVADVSESDNGAHIVISAGIRGGIIAAMAYRVWGCPHLIAALEHMCTTFEGQPVAGLENFDSADITQELSVPVEKAGRILLLEEALATLWAQYAGTEDQG
jgi:NifU-like protein involved in Fe-S cluster formation